jgi:single-stranded DNA-binding protein
VKHYRTEIVADRVQFGPRGGDAGGNYQAAGATGAANGKTEQPSAPVMPEYPTEEINPEDIPF